MLLCSSNILYNQAIRVFDIFFLFSTVIIIIIIYIRHNAIGQPAVVHRHHRAHDQQMCARRHVQGDRMDVLED